MLYDLRIMIPNLFVLYFNALLSRAGDVILILIQNEPSQWLKGLARLQVPWVCVYPSTNEGKVRELLLERLVLHFAAILLKLPNQNLQLHSQKRQHGKDRVCYASSARPLPMWPDNLHQHEYAYGHHHLPLHRMS